MRGAESGNSVGSGCVCSRGLGASGRVELAGLSAMATLAGGSGRHTIVAETRNAFQLAMQDKFISAVEQLSGRRVLAFMSDSNVGPDLEIELFVLEPDGHDPVER